MSIAEYLSLAVEKANQRTAGGPPCLFRPAPPLPDKNDLSGERFERYRLERSDRDRLPSNGGRS